MFHTSTGTTSCGGAAGSPAPAAPFTGAIYSDTAGTTLLGNLGASCLYVGGGGNTATAPNANPDGPNTIFGVASCPGNTLNLAASAGTGAVAGNNNGWGHPLGVDCTLGPLTTRHCTRLNPANCNGDPVNCTCTTDADCQNGASQCNDDPQCIFGPPLPVPAGSVSTCVLNIMRADATGSIPDKTVGNSNITLPLASYVYLTGNTQKFCRNGADGVAGAGAANPVGQCTSDANCTDLPGSTGACVTETACPTCENVGTGVNHCISGKNHGQACTPVGSKKTTADCLPRGLDFIAPLNVDLSPLSTGTQTLTAVANPARSGQFFFCPAGGGAATCTPAAGVVNGTCQRTQGAFGRTAAKSIKETGAQAGNLTDNAAHNVTIAAVFCIPSTGNALIDGGTGADLPGPGAVSIVGTFQIVP